MMFIYTIHPTGFDYGSLMSKRFTGFTEQEHLLWPTYIMVSLINKVIHCVFAGRASDIHRVINASFRL